MRSKPLIAAALAAVFAVSCAQFKEKFAGQPSNTSQSSDTGAQSTAPRTTSETPLAAGGAGGNGGSTGTMRY